MYTAGRCGCFAGAAVADEFGGRLFFLDGKDLRLVARGRGDHNRQGFGVQLTTVRGGKRRPRVALAQGRADNESRTVYLRIHGTAASGLRSA